MKATLMEKGGVWSSLIWTLKLLYEFKKKYLFIIFGTAVINGIFPIISLLVVQNLMNSIQLLESRESLFFKISLYVFFSFLISSVQNLFNYLKLKYSLAFNLKINRLIMEKLSMLTLRDYEDSNTYDKINRAQSEGNGKIVSYVENFVNIVSIVISILSYLIILLQFNPILGLATLLIPISKFIVGKKINVLKFNVSYARTEKVRKAWYYQYVLSYGKYFKDLLIFNLFPFFISNYLILTRKFNQQDVQIEKKNLFYKFGLGLFSGLMEMGIMIYLIDLGIRGRLLVGNVMLYISSVIQVNSNLDLLQQMLSGMVGDTLFLKQLRDFMEMEEYFETGTIELEGINSITVSELSFGYSNLEDTDLNNINLRFEKGKKYAIVGESGSGKTTLIKILVGMYDNYSGEIHYNDKELKQITRQSLMKKVSILFQDYLKFEGTFRQNIELGDVLNSKNEDILEEILGAFQIKELVDNYSDKLDTQIGQWFENGIQISQGQWQRLALARAFNKQAELIILDEPNSSLDSKTDFLIVNQYYQLLENKIGIFIVHGGLQYYSKLVDKIIVMSDGNITGIGTHKELIDNNEIYREIYFKQIGEK